MIKLKEIVNSFLLETLSFKDLIKYSEPNRIDRAKKVNTKPLRVVTQDDQEAWTFSYKSNPSTTGLRYQGYVKFLKEEVKIAKDNPENIDCVVDCQCLTGDTGILMKDGTYTPIKDVKIGDEVYTHTGNVKRITNVICRYPTELEKCYEIKTVGFPFSIKVTENHPFYVLRGNEYCKCGCGESVFDSKVSQIINKTISPEILLDSKFIKGHYRRSIPTECLEDIFKWKKVSELRNQEWFLFPWLKSGNKNVSPEFARLIGYYLSDGCIPNKKGNVVRFTFHNNEWDTLGNDILNISKMLGFEVKRKKVNPIFGNWFNVCVYNKAFKLFCIHNIGEGSKTKKLSQFIMDWDNESMLNLIVGSFLGDGNVDKSGKIRYSSINFNLISQLSTMFNKLKLYHTTSIGNKNFLSFKNPTYQISLSRGESRDMLYDALLPFLRKKDIIEISNENIRNLRHVCNIGQLRTLTSKKEIILNELVYDVTVEDDESFVANGIVVHNCPDYKYRWAVANKKQNAGVTGPTSLNKSNDSAPIVNNPSERPGLCIAEGEFVSTKRGYIPIETVTVNDDVWTLDGWKPVVNSRFNGNKNIIKITTRTGRTIQLTPEHKVFVFNEENGFDWIESKNLTRKDFLCSYLPTDIDHIDYIINVQEFKYNKRYYPNQILKLDETLAELIGYMTAEGSHRIFAGQDERLIKDFSDKWKQKFGENSITIYPNYGCNIGVHGDTILSELGFKFGSYNKTVPECIMRGNKSIVVAFLRGCYAGDGNFRNKHSTYATVSEDLAKKMHILLNFIGVNVTVKRYKSGVNNSPTWTLRTSSLKETEKLFSLLNPIRGYSFEKTCPMATLTNITSYHNRIVKYAKQFFKRIIEKTFPKVNQFTEIKLVNANTYISEPIPYVYGLSTLLKKANKLKTIRYKKSGKAHNVASIYDIYEVTRKFRANHLISNLNLEDTTGYMVHKDKLVNTILKLENLAPNAFLNLKPMLKDLTFDQFDHIEYMTVTKNVYDLTVLDAEHYTVNGIIVHNCKHLISLGAYLDTNISPKASGTEKLPVNIFESFNSFATRNKEFNIDVSE